MADERARRVWLVGEQNPYGSDPEMALYPLPRRAAGARLARILELGTRAYLRLFERRNLLGRGKWSAPRAREAAAAIRAELRDGDAVVLLGEKVAAAFGRRFEPLAVHRAFADDPREPWMMLLCGGERAKL